MKNTTARSSKSQSLLFVAGGILSTILVIGLSTFVSGKPPEGGLIFIGFISVAFFTVLGCLVAFGKNKTPLVSNLPEPLNQLVATELKASGLSYVIVRHGFENKNVKAYPRPMPINNYVTIPERICNDWSPQALCWSIKTDSAASVAFVRKTFFWLLVFMLGILVLVRLLERWKAPGWTVGLAFSLIIVGFVLWGYIGYKLQLKYDRQFTKTAEDLAAAKEALSYPYFAQSDKKLFTKWMFFRAELTGRAKNLGIELERGFKVESV